MSTNSPRLDLGSQPVIAPVSAEDLELERRILAARRRVFAELEEEEKARVRKLAEPTKGSAALTPNPVP